MSTVDSQYRVVSDSYKKSKAKNLEKSRLSALFVASLPGFEPWAFRLGGGIVIVSEANNKVLKRQLEVLISILLHKKAVRFLRTALAPPGGIEPSTAP